MNRLTAALLVLMLAAATRATLLAQVPPADAIPNWPVPATWSPSMDTGGIQTMTDVTGPRVFVGIAPCRIADTRTGQGFSGQAGPPILSANTTRNFQISGSPATLPAPPNGCPANAIPVSAEAVSLQFTIVSPSDGGNLVAWPANQAQPQVSVLNWSAGTVALGSGTILALSNVGVVSVRLNMAVGQVAHLVIDVNGYFGTRPQNPANYLELINSSNSYTVYLENQSASCGGVCGLFQRVANGTAIYGESNGNSLDLRGVQGHVASLGANSAGVQGTIGSVFSVNACCGPAGVRGQSPHVGVVGLGKDIGVAGRLYNSDGNAIAAGDLATPASSTIAYGVVGTSLISGGGSAGVRGVDYSGEPSAPGFTCCGIAGVRGASFSHTGVDGVSRNGTGVTAWNKDVNGDNATFAWLGVSDTVAIQYSGALVGPLSASVIEPHPTDAGKAIRYTSLEGNEAGTYFRGRGKFERGLARITVPEDFRIITDPEGLTVQITPIGEMASYAVVRVGLDEIVVKSSRSVEFFYAVNGVRRAHRDQQPLVSSEEFFMPASPDQKLPTYFSAEDKRRLIANGTYKEDGTVNLETAERLGWTRIWEERKKSEEEAAALARAESTLEVLSEP